jgi:intracellular multiplication protein IcmV
MKIRDVFYYFVRPYISPITKFPTYMGLKQIADTTKAIGGMLKPVFVPPRPAEKTAESFAETLTRLNLTEQDVQKRQREFRRLLTVYLVIALLLFCYSFYLAWHRSIHGALAGFVITLVALTQVFRYHFWLFQLRQRKLGCTLRDWWNSGFLGENNQ